MPPTALPRRASTRRRSLPQEGSLLIWTHQRKNITWHDDGFVAAGCLANTAAAAVTVQSGVQFEDLYPVAERRGKFVNGGGCTSVGVGGCTLGGCFGSFSQRLGPSASNLLQVRGCAGRPRGGAERRRADACVHPPAPQARIVLANGTLVTASKCRHADLFWALRGGGAGFGVVTEFTFRSYRSPRFITAVGYEGVLGSARPEDVLAVAAEVLRTADGVAEARQGWNGGWSVPHRGSTRFGVSLSSYEGDEQAARALLAPLAAWVDTQAARMNVSGRLTSSVRQRGLSWLGGLVCPRRSLLRL